MMLRDIMRGVVAHLIALAMILVVAPKAAAAIIYDNLPASTPGSFRSVATDQLVAERFTSDATNIVLSSATLNLKPQTAGLFNVSLYSDVSGHPGSAIGTLFSGTTADGVGAGGNVTYSGLNLTMQPNTNYWIVAGVPAAQSGEVLWANSANTSGTGSGFAGTTTATSGDQGAHWTATPTTLQDMQLVANVPEPVALSFVALSVGCFGRRRRR